MELKGIITVDGACSLTCCQSVPNIKIGDDSLYEKLEELFNLDSEKFFNDSNHPSPQYGVKYVILNEVPAEQKSFNDLCAEVQMNMLYAQHTCGCYSEYTCGYGGFDYVLGSDGNGHSVFDELKDHVGKYCHFQI